MSNQEHALIGLAFGSNIGDRLSALRAAITAIAPYVDITAVSKVYKTKAAYVTDQPAFLNATCLGTTKLEPLALLWMLKDIESEIGRTPTYRFGPRMIDIDILFYGDVILTTPELTLPHPRMTERDFVLRPLNDIASQWRHPTGKTVADLLASLSDEEMVCLDESL